MLFLRALTIFYRIIRFVRGCRYFFFQGVLRGKCRVFSIRLFYNQVGHGFVCVFRESLAFHVGTPSEVRLVVPRFGAPKVVLYRQVSVGSSSAREGLPQGLCLADTFVPRLCRLFLRLVRVSRAIAFGVGGSTSSLFRQRRRVRASISTNGGNRFFLFRGYPSRARPLPSRGVSIGVYLGGRGVLYQVGVCVFIVRTMVLVSFLYITLVVHGSRVV